MSKDFLLSEFKFLSYSFNEVQPPPTKVNSFSFQRKTATRTELSVDQCTDYYEESILITFIVPPSNEIKTFLHLLST